MDGGSIRTSFLASDAQRLATALLGDGHRRIALIAAEAPAVADQFRTLSEHAIAARAPAAMMIETGADLDRVFFTVFRGTRYPTGLVCADAATAEAALASLQWLGFRVPDDVTIRWLGDDAQPSFNVRLNQDSTSSATAASRPL